MNEAVRIRLHVDGKHVPIDSLSQRGIILHGETAASPRGVAINLTPRNAITEFRLRRVRMIQDWAPRTFRFNVGLEDGALVCRGVDLLSFPFGAYDLRVLISDLNGIAQPLAVDVPDGGTAEVTAKFRHDSRKFKLVTPVDQFDDAVKTVVLEAGSVVDGMNVPAWLDGPARPRRKACLLNILAKARAARGPAPKSNLIRRIKSIFWAEVDRIYVRVRPEFLADLRTLAADHARPFYFEGEPKSASHRRLLDCIGPGGQNLESDAALFHLQSFRQEGKVTMQAVVAIPPGGDPGRPHYADLDIDLGNPLQDLEGLFIHCGELLDPGQTDHLKLAEKLSSGPTADFLYYKVVR